MSWKDIKSAPRARRTFILLIDAYGIESEGAWYAKVWRDRRGNLIVAPTDWKYLDE